jgi:hypothetical protein
VKLQTVTKSFDSAVFPQITVRGVAARIMPSSFMHVTCGEGQKVTCSDCVGRKLQCASSEGEGKLFLAHAIVAYRLVEGGGGDTTNSFEDRGQRERGLGAVAP